jgi:hypothetical protein
MWRPGTFAVATLLLCAGCVEPGDRYQDFLNRSGNRGAGGSDAGRPDGGTCTVLPNSISGNYLLALSIVLAPTKPIVLLTGLTTPPFNGGTGLSFDAQPLSATDRTTPVGTPLVLGPFPVDANGHFQASVSGLNVTGAANSVTPGAAITADVTLTGNLCGDGSFFCGTVSGHATQPITVSLTGSTFTLTQVTTPGALPARPKINCAGALADPL